MPSDIPETQTAVIQSMDCSSQSLLPLTISHTRTVPELPSPHHVLVRVLAVGLNPTDYKMVTHFFMEGNTIGCDFCGVVDQAGTSSLVTPGTRVCGADFPYRPHTSNGAFAQYVVADSRHVLRVPDSCSDSQGAAFGAIGWCTACLAISDPEALDLQGLPSKAVDTRKLVLVYGGATATGIIAIQLLKQSGYMPIAVCSNQSSSFVLKLGAIGTTSYTDEDCVKRIHEIAGGVPIKHALDCITDGNSTATCFKALARVGGRYACLEHCSDAWRTRRAVKVKTVMGFEALGYDVNLDHPTYAREVNWQLHSLAMKWRDEVQALLNQGLITTQKIRTVEGGFDGIIKAMEMMRCGEIRGEKLVVSIT